MDLLSFDIEISNIFDLKEGEDLLDYAPFDISVGCTAEHEGDEQVFYTVNDDDGQAGINMSRKEAQYLLDHLDGAQRDGFKVCAWNGLGFDLRWIGHVAQNVELASKIALKSFDPMFQFFNLTGFPVSLAKVAEAMGIEQEKLMDGADAPKQWRDGHHQLVMDYCMGDCQMTNQIVLAIMEAGEVRWVTAKGATRSKPMPKLRTVEEVLRDPEPYNGWMDTPIKRENFCAWLK